MRSIEILDVAPAPRVKRIARNMEVPDYFRAEVELEGLPLVLTVQVEVGVGGQAQARSLVVTAPAGASVTTSGLHKVLVDQILRAAVIKAARPMTPRPDLGPDVWETPGPGYLGEPGPIIRMQPDSMPPAGTREQRQDERAHEAARIYRSAVESGIPAPAQAVVTEMGYSRSQVARYIRRARELGILPSTESQEASE